MGLKFFEEHPDLTLFSSIAVGTMTAAATVLGVSETLGFDLEWLKTHRFFAVYVLLLQSAAAGALAVAFRHWLVGRRSSSVSGGGDYSPALALDVTKSLQAALNAHKYFEVMRIGAALSRPLFEGGNFQARLDIGTLVEEAAAAVGDERTQMMSLIDAIGWSSVELGEISRAQGKIRHGLEVARSLKDWFYISKANRHLGVICRRQNKYEAAAKYYEEAEEAANRIDNSEKRRDATAGLAYARATLYMHLKKYSEALQAVDLAIRDSADSNDAYRLTMALTLKGNIFFEAGKIPEAKDTFRKALRSADDNSQRLLSVRSYIGLTRVYRAEANWSKAAEMLEQAAKLADEIHSEGEILEIRQLAKTLPKPELTTAARKLLGSGS